VTYDYNSSISFRYPGDWQKFVDHVRKQHGNQYDREIAKGPRGNFGRQRMTYRELNHVMYEKSR